MNTAGSAPFQIAADRPLSEACSTAPNVGDVVLGLMRPLVFKILRTRFERGLSESTFTEVEAAGHVQPFGHRELELLPEGQRAWKWVSLFACFPLILKEADRVNIGGKEYSVMSDADWRDSGFARYNLVEGYDKARRTAP